MKEISEYPALQAAEKSMRRRLTRRGLYLILLTAVFAISAANIIYKLWMSNSESARNFLEIAPDCLLSLALFCILMVVWKTSRSRGTLSLKEIINCESEVRHSRRVLRNILECLPCGIAIVGKDKTLRYMNKTALRLTGYQDQSELLDRVCHKTFCPAEVGKCPILDLGQQIDNAERAVITKEGSKVPILKTVIPVVLDQEEVMLEAFVDLTQRKKAEQELKEYSIALESANKSLEQLVVESRAATLAKSEFLANMSHEIRTPLTAILGFADILSINADNADDAEALDTIKRNGEFLLRIINDILDLSKIEAGQLVVYKNTNPLSQILTDVISLMRIRAAAKHLSLEIEYAGPVPAMIYTDPIRLRQILINLLGNAIKFTDKGCIRLRIELLPRKDGQKMLQFEVIDTGIGIMAEDMAHLFQPFTQGKSDINRKSGGTGLGLAISKRLARILGGEITAKSVCSKGSTFTLTIDPGPLDEILLASDPSKLTGEKESESSQIDNPKIMLNGRILLAEDGPDNQRLISLVLKSAGAEVTLADNGQSAIDKIKALSPHEKPFDLILMDMQMPVLNGYEATKCLREMGYSLPIVAVTAYAMSGDQQKCLDAGCDDYIPKPIDRNRLLSKAAQHIKHGCSGKNQELVAANASADGMN
jgi:PAS domain S-box-containing protein